MARTTEKPKEGMGARVERARLEKGWSQEDLAEKLHTTRSSVKNKELGLRPFSIEEANIMCELFHTNLDYLVNGVMTRNVSIHEATGLSNEAIWKLKRFNYQESPEKVAGLSKALAFYEVLVSIAAFMNRKTDIKGEYLSISGEEEGMMVNVTMSQEFYEEVLGQHVVHMMREAKMRTEEINFLCTNEELPPPDDEKEGKNTIGKVRYGVDLER